MLILNAFVALFTLSSPTASSNNDLVFVIDHLDNAIVWTTASRTETLTKQQAIDKLQRLTAKTDATFTLKHESAWKNGKSYKIIELNSEGNIYRVFFHCKKIGDDTVVNRIKVTQL